LYKGKERNEISRSNQRVAAACAMNNAFEKSALQTYFNDIINVSGHCIEVKGDALARLSEINSFVSAIYNGRFNLVVACWDKQTRVHAVHNMNV
jgi:hypothetical protein